MTPWGGCTARLGTASDSESITPTRLGSTPRCSRRPVRGLRRVVPLARGASRVLEGGETRDGGLWSFVFGAGWPCCVRAGGGCLGGRQLSRREEQQ
jgi:hypothetical protein